MFLREKTKLLLRIHTFCPKDQRYRSLSQKKVNFPHLANYNTRKDNNDPTNHLTIAMETMIQQTLVTIYRCCFTSKHIIRN